MAAGFGGAWRFHAHSMLVQHQISAVFVSHNYCCYLLVAFVGAVSVCFTACHWHQRLTACWHCYKPLQILNIWRSYCCTFKLNGVVGSRCSHGGSETAASRLCETSCQQGAPVPICQVAAMIMSSVSPIVVVPRP